MTFTTSNSDINRLLEISGELFDLRAAAGLLQWDQETYMPPKGIIHRSRQLATISGLIHEKLTRPEVGKLLSRLDGKAKTEADQALVRELKRDYDRAVKIPESLVREIAEATSAGLETWKMARREKKFNLFAKPLERILDLERREAELIGFKDSPYDALLDNYEPDLTVVQTQKLFGYLRREIAGILKEIEAAKKRNNLVKPQVLRGQRFSQAVMLRVTQKILVRMGFDFSAGRQDLSAHPFTINFGHQDVRVTNRYIPHDLASSIFSAVHEGGHALYELGISEKLGNTTLAGGTSLGIHESQSRLWENFVGRSEAFWKFWAPYLKVDAEQVYREANWVEPGFIRVDADEVTYNLHIILRFEIEKALVEGNLKVVDLPEVWNAKMRELLGIVPPDVATGVLQDIHWSQGSIGYFPTYTLGNLYAAQFYRQLGDVSRHVESGNFEPILAWLRKNIHQYGSVYRAKELVKKVTGEGLRPQYFVDYLRSKYGRIYGFGT
jgi:carboxypeptidase Taq